MAKTAEDQIAEEYHDALFTGGKPKGTAREISKERTTGSKKRTNSHSTK